MYCLSYTLYTCHHKVIWSYCIIQESRSLLSCHFILLLSDCKFRFFCHNFICRLWLFLSIFLFYWTDIIQQDFICRASKLEKRKNNFKRFCINIHSLVRLLDLAVHKNDPLGNTNGEKGQHFVAVQPWKCDPVSPWTAATLLHSNFC